MSYELTYNGHHVFTTIPNDDYETLTNLAADLANYCVEHDIKLVPRGNEYQDNPNGSITVRFAIRSM